MISDSTKQATDRAEFEEKVKSENTAHEWVKYITFEIKQEQVKRAYFVYQRALGSSLEIENDIKFFLSYTNFILEHMKDSALVKAKFE